ncbi:glycosyl hydrolase family 16 [Flavobacterium croceum DSM 17960]|uniref:Glycosyl hydrolase family 16 n=1 Tax=Flavobacterium croceum DSM 17960 TaxID=1121886 RepID=A0A2S4N830_9FLAO|nr:glycoside hydrolase family 16 protein [Flavobacterium croceum]POS01846.1 glycosyl hydrolase family 16 [Flavobacterium croceum DSM 17960]
MTHYKFIIKFFAITPLLFLASSCQVDDKQKIEQKNWSLVWSDDFNDASGTQPNPTKWTYDIGNSGWGNSELQYYTNRPENVATDGNGNLVITAKSEIYNGAPFTSARIKTQGLFSQKQGRFEARIKTPYGPGIWPAFWLLSDNVNTVGWPQCGEIDIMELRGQQPHIINGSLHGPGYSGGNAMTTPYSIPNTRFDVDYHLFAVEWYEDHIDYFVDDYLYQRIKKSDVSGEWVFNNSSFYIILNVAVGGNYVGFPTAQTPFPQKMYIDYVKVYQ